MSAPDRRPDSEVAVRYLSENFEPDDRLALVLINRGQERVIQRLASRDEITGADVQAWLRDLNRAQCEVYISMNALHPTAQGRRKDDVAAIRHLYLDFDEDGTARVDALLKRHDVPKPNHLINSSPGKWQVSWRVHGFPKEDAESLQRALARETGADPAATDVARVMRLPGFYNHKYDTPHLVLVETLTREVRRPEDFHGLTKTYTGARTRNRVGAPRNRSGPLSQSEHDWAFAKRALARGVAPEMVIEAIASYRRHDKHNPRYYAELTVWKAVQELHRERAEGLERG